VRLCEALIWLLVQQLEQLAAGAELGGCAQFSADARRRCAAERTSMTKWSDVPV
jgi:hypothetical protein